MFNLKDNNILKFFTAFSLIVMLTACSSNDGDAIVFDPTVAPQNVQVVSGDDNTGEVRNTISWTRDPANPDYVVYVSNTPGVTESSSEVVPTDHGFTFVTHSGVELKGNDYYYRVQAVSGGLSSPLSDEVTGTAQQSITDKALNDVAWNGTDTLVAVGAAGVILSSPNGMADGWTDASDASTTNILAGVTWGSNQFLIVGAGGTVLTGNGITWDPKDLSNLATAPSLEDVAWLGDGYIAVGKNGAIITSDAAGSVWTEQNPGTGFDTTTLNGVASNGTIIVVVGANGTILTSPDSVNWQLQTVPAVVDTHSMNDVTWDGKQFGVVGSNDTILTSPDGVDWTRHIPGTSSIAFIAASQWDSSLPANPVLGTVGSAGTFVVSPDATTGFSVPTGTNQQLSGMTWIDNVTPPYFVMVGNDGTVLTSQLQ